MTTHKTCPPILMHSIECAGSQAKLARAMKVSKATVTHWVKVKLPEAVAARLVQKYGKKVPNPPSAWVPPV